MSEPGGSSLFGQGSYQQHGELRCRRSRLRASLSVSSTLRKVATDVGPPSAELELDDLRIAQGLLSETCITALSGANTRAMSQQGNVPSPSQHRARHASAPSLQAGEPQAHSRITSTTWSTVSNRVFTNSSQSTERDALEFLAEYNRLGSKHGLPRICHDVPSAVAAGTSPPPTQPPVSWLFRKLLRKTSSGHTVRHCSNLRLTRNSSVSDIALLGRGRKDVLKDRTLEDIARLGGECVFLLPAGSASGPLTIPSCFSATGMFILQHGMKTPGIFRVPGSSITINALYEHYSRQFQDTEKSVQLVQQTISSGQIPHHIPCNVHDVASVFKKLLVGLPGGILGSVPLFKALTDIRTALFPSPDLLETHQRKVEARLIALAIASFGSGYSMALMCAVFGLLNLIGTEAENTPSAKEEGQNPMAKDTMGYEALGVIFGPLLLGNKIELVELHSEDDRGGLLIIPESPTRQRGGRRKRNAAKATYNSVNAQVERARMAAGVAEMLIRSWKEVARQLRNIGAMGSDQSGEAAAGDAVGGGAGATVTESPEHHHREQASGSSQSVAEVTEKQSNSREFQIAGDTIHSALQPLPESDVRQSLPPSRAQVGPSLLNAQPLTLPTSADLGSIESDNLPVESSPTQQLQHPWAAETERAPSSTTGGHPVSIHASFSGETIRFEAEPDSISIDLEGIGVASPENPIEEAIGGDTWSNQRQSMGPCGPNSANNRRLSAYQTRLCEGTNGQDIRPLTIVGKSTIIKEEISPQDLGSVEGQVLRDPGDLGDLDLAASLMDLDRETCPQYSMDIGKQLPPESVNLRDAQYLQQHSPTRENSGSGSLSPRPDACHILGWPLDMTDTALILIAEPVAASLHGEQSQKLGNGPQPYVEASNRGTNTVFRTTTPKEHPPLQAPVVPRNSGGTNATPPSSAKSLKSLHLPDMLCAQDVPTRGSSVSQTVIKSSPPRSATPVIRKPGTASADRLDKLLPPAEEPEVARRISWRNSSELGTSRASSEQGLTPKLSTKGNATLYAEIRRLQRLLDLRTEEAIQAQRELEAMRKFKDSGTLSEKLREAQRDLKTWKNRAEWAEKRLLIQDTERRGTAPTKKRGDDALPTRGNRRTIGLDRATMM